MERLKTMKTKLIKPFTGLTLKSIEANAKSCYAQLQEYEFLAVSNDQLHKLVQIERELHELVKEITKSI